MSAPDRGRRPREIVGRHFGTIVGAFAVALTAAAITAPGASAASDACVYGAFGPPQGNSYEPCVRDEQVLLNDLTRALGPQSGMYLIATDGYYGQLTSGDVGQFNWLMGDIGDDTTQTQTWINLCWATGLHGFHGAYWHGAGCQLIA